MVSFCGVRAIGDFIDARRALLGFKTVSAFSRASNVSRPTLDRILDAETAEELSSQRATLEQVAEHLQFREWHELRRAWEEDDVRRGMDRVLLSIPRETYANLEYIAKRDGIASVVAWIERAAHPELTVQSGALAPEGAKRPQARTSRPSPKHPANH